VIDFKVISETIKDGLYNWLKGKGYECPVIMANQTLPIPNYPYISYTITSTAVTNGGTFSVTSDYTRFKPMTQIWSFTVQSNDDKATTDIALLAYDWFSLVSNTYLSDNGIVVQRVGNITNRDNLLTIEYEYRQGFDVEFSLLHTISAEDSETAETIETVEFNKEV
jgi:hypothetical protein